jgi:hypothetical protein
LGVNIIASTQSGVWRWCSWRCATGGACYWADNWDVPTLINPAFGRTYMRAVAGGSSLCTRPVVVLFLLLFILFLLCKYICSCFPYMMRPLSSWMKGSTGSVFNKRCKNKHYPNGCEPVANPRTSAGWDPLKPAISDQVSDHSLWVGDITAQAHFPTKHPEDWCRNFPDVYVTQSGWWSKKKNESRDLSTFVATVFILFFYMIVLIYLICFYVHTKLTNKQGCFRCIKALYCSYFIY